MVETHISWVLLGDEFAYKLKKPVKLPFLDFTTIEARRHFCEEELRLNRRLAPSLYLEVMEVREGSDGPCFGGGDGTLVDFAVRMRRFPDGALWSDMLAAGALVPHHVDALAQRLAGFHRDAAVAPADSRFGIAEVNERIVQRVIDANDEWAARPGAANASWPALRAWLVQQLRILAPCWTNRLREGRVRECHGDLHLSNVLQLDGEATAFDGIEFDDELRWIDVLNDAAFLAMDLLAQGRRDLAFRFLNAYLDETGDHAGLPTLRFYMVYRALVRAQVAAIKEEQGGAMPDPQSNSACYIELAVSLSRGVAPRLAITHGLPGSGKSFVSQRMLEATGAIRVRSDVERKRLFGLSALQSSREHVPGGIYDGATTAKTYGVLLDVARIGLQAGWPVIVDAAFLRRSERAEFASLAASLGVSFAIVDCRAPLPVLRARIEKRQASGGDASEADVAVLDRLANADEALDETERAVAIMDGTSFADPAAWASRRPPLNQDD